MTDGGSLSGARCLVLGGGGFIGTNLCSALTAAGAVVTGYGRPPRYAPRGDRWIDAAFDDHRAIAAAVDGADIVFHLLGSADPGGSNRNPGDDARRWVPASLSVLEACRTARIRRLVFLSSGGTVYRPSLPLPIAEDAPTDPISAYGIGKLTVEKYCGLFRHLYGLDCITLRIANPYGPCQSPDRGQGFIAKLMRQALVGEPVEVWGDGSVVRDFIYIADVVDAIVAAGASVDVAGPLNIGSGIGRTLRSVIHDVGTVVGRPVDLIFQPGRAADSPANILDIGAAQRELGWRPRTDWFSGLALTRDWIAGL